MLHSIKIALCSAVIAFVSSFNASAEAAKPATPVKKDQVAKASGKVVVGKPYDVNNPEKVVLKYTCPQWQKQVFQSASSAVRFNEFLARLGFEVTLNAGSTQNEYLVYYRSLRNQYETFTGANAHANSASRLQFMVGQRINVQVIRNTAK